MFLGHCFAWVNLSNSADMGDALQQHSARADPGAGAGYNSRGHADALPAHQRARQIFLRLLLERALAAGAAEVVGLSLVLSLPARRRDLDGHTADRVDRAGRRRARDLGRR